MPIHLPRGGFASLTGLRTGKAHTVLEDAQQSLSDFGLISHALQEAAYPLFSNELRTYPHIRLTKRERECLKWAADGLTAAEIATQLSRSLAVVTLHLASAMHKLGAKNPRTGRGARHSLPLAGRLTLRQNLAVLLVT